MAKKRIPSTDELLRIARAVSADARSEKIDHALLGGVALSLYGSPRLTKDIDFAAAAYPEKFPEHKNILTFGGRIYPSADDIDIDWIVRDDEYQELYEEAVKSATVSDEGLKVVSLEYLAAIKFATLRPKDYEDLMFLLAHPDINLENATKIVRRHLGGKFAEDQFKMAIEEARWRASRE